MTNIGDFWQEADVAKPRCRKGALVMFQELTPKTKIKRFLLFLLIPVFLASCGTRIDVSYESCFKNIVRHSIALKRPQNLYEIDYQINGFRDRYNLGGYIGGKPLVGIVPAGQTVYFERAVCEISIDYPAVYLEGTLKYQGKVYPIAVFSGDGQDADFWTSMNYNYVVPKESDGR